MAHADLAPRGSEFAPARVNRGLAEILRLLEASASLVEPDEIERVKF